MSQPVTRRGRPRHPDTLTPRQAEVLTLVREGLSNREIAERLDISLDGVKFHVSEIISRTGVTTRREAAEWQRRREQPAATLRMWRSRPRLRTVPIGSRPRLRTVPIGSRPRPRTLTPSTARRAATASRGPRSTHVGRGWGRGLTHRCRRRRLAHA
jgi:DNA-binding CsgD family transcriptional regulator